MRREMSVVKLEAEAVEHYFPLTTFTMHFVCFLLLSQQKPYFICLKKFIMEKVARARDGLTKSNLVKHFMFISKTHYDVDIQHNFIMMLESSSMQYIFNLKLTKNHY